MKLLNLLSVFALLSWPALTRSYDVVEHNNIIFVLIDSGEYVRGFLHEKGGIENFDRAHQFSNRQETMFEKPPHRVYISNPFQLSQTEITVGQFKTFINETKYVTDAEKSDGALGFFPEKKNYVDKFQQSKTISWKNPGFKQTDSHPVVCVSWNDAQSFCRWLTAKGDAIYRLPTEAEWEYACRAGTNTWYSWGSDPNDAYQYGNVADASLEAAYPNMTRFQRAIRLQKGEGDGVVFTSKVKSFKPNAWGLFDMHGNVWELCQDRWSESIYEEYFKGVAWNKKNEVLITDPIFLKKTDLHIFGDWRVMRGGAWTCAPAGVRSTIRTFTDAKDSSVYTGFRVLREIPKN